MPEMTFISRDEFRDLKTYAERTHHDKNNLALVLEGLKVELANQKESQGEAWTAINNLREAFGGIRSTVAGIVAVSAIIQTVLVAFIVWKITH
jgi:hypothetical protein